MIGKLPGRNRITLTHEALAVIVARHFNLGRDIEFDGVVSVEAVSYTDGAINFVLTTDEPSPQSMTTRQFAESRTVDIPITGFGTLGCEGDGFAEKQRAWPTPRERAFDRFDHINSGRPIYGAWQQARGKRP